MMRKLFFLFTLSYAVVAHADNVVNVFNWGDYLPNTVIQAFEKETGITVNYSTFEDNPELYAKLKLNPNTYDVIVPSSYLADQLIDEHLLQPLDYTQLPNSHALNPAITKLTNSQYTLPYFWGTLGIAVNDKFYDPATITTWQDLWQPRFAGQLLVMDESREVFNVALSLLGYSVNDQAPAHLKAAYEKLKLLLPNIKLFNESQEASIFADEDVAIGMTLNGDAYRAYQGNHHIHYIYPQGSLLVWVDTLAIPVGAPNLANAYRFINFIMRPDIAAQIATTYAYSSPNLAAITRLPAPLRDSPILYPPANRLAHSEVSSSDSDATKMRMEHDWELLKLAL